MQSFLDQALATTMNYIKTGRSNKAIETISQINKAFPEYELSKDIMNFIAFGKESNKIIDFMGCWWNGESLEGKSIQVFCDQGMGDTINLLRYLKAMKEKWKCKIILNNYAFYEEMKELFKCVNYVYEFVSHHEKCDYYTNIMSVPALFNGLKFDVYYPVHWEEVMKMPIPNQETICCPMADYDLGFKNYLVGIAWRSNLDNPIGKKKSIDVEEFIVLEDGINNLYSLIPSKEKFNMMTSLPLNNLYDTAELIDELDVVVTVDTAVLHLAGAMHVKTLALLPFEADPRWGSGDRTVWYPTVEIYRQKDPNDWSSVLKQVKERLVSLRKII